MLKFIVGLKSCNLLPPTVVLSRFRLFPPCGLLITCLNASKCYLMVKLIIIITVLYFPGSSLFSIVKT